MKGLIIGFIVLIILVVGVILFKSMGKNGNTNTSPSNNSVDQSQTQVDQNEVLIKNFSFSPNVLTIKKGTTVTWTNQDSVKHTVNSDIFDSNDLSQGDKFRFTFTDTGTFNYTCGIHPNMTGKIVVE